jgi:hypothetical protein
MTGPVLVLSTAGQVGTETMAEARALVSKRSVARAAYTAVNRVESEPGGAFGAKATRRGECRAGGRGP